MALAPLGLAVVMEPTETSAGFGGPDREPWFWIPAGGRRPSPQRPVAPAVEDQRAAAGRRQVGDLAGEDHVVAGGDHVAQVAGDPEQGVVDRGQAVALGPGDAVPLLDRGGLGRKGT